MSPSFAATRTTWRRMAFAVGPGLVAMLADTDAGSVITVAQSGAQWQYRLLLLQFLLIPAMFVAQELAGRVGLCTGKGFVELILERFGRAWAALAIAVLAISCFGALVTQMSGLAGAARVFGVPVWQGVAFAVVMIFIMVVTGSYRSVERIAILLGLFELAYVVVAWKAAPNIGEMATQLVQMPLGDANYLYLLAANLGTGVIPWTIIYQQSASVDKGLTRHHIRGARIETLAAVILCQVVTSAMLVAAGAALYGKTADARLTNIGEIANALTPVLGDTVGRVVFAVGLCGGALVATVVVCLTLTWGIGEVLGVRHSLEHHPGEAPWFYGVLGVILVTGGVFVASGIDLVALAIAAGVVNALLLPIVLAFQYRLARTALPASERLAGGYAIVVGGVFLITAAVAVTAGLAGAIG